MRPTRASAAGEGARPTKLLMVLIFAGAENTAERAQRTMFIAALSMGREFAAHLLQRHTLQNHAPRASQCREEKPFAAENGRLDSTDELYIVVDRFIECHNATGL